MTYPGSEDIDSMSPPDFGRGGLVGATEAEPSVGNPAGWRCAMHQGTGLAHIWWVMDHERVEVSHTPFSAENYT